jgi:putative peptidoglycan lipid II flippase
VTAVAVTFTVIGSVGPPAHAATWVGLGQTVSNVVAAVLGLWLLRRRLGSLGLTRVVRTFVRLGLATLVGTAIGWVVLRGLGQVVDGSTWIGSVVLTTVVGLVVLVLSIAIAARLRVTEVTETLEPFARRLRPG